MSTGLLGFESVQERQQAFDLFVANRDAGWRNRLIWGDKKYVLPSLADEFTNAVDLVYIDPPFATGADFSLPLNVGDSGFTKQPNVIEQTAYRDTWGISPADRAKGVTSVDRYLRWFYHTAVLLRPLMSGSGSIYVHIGPNMSHYVRAVLDEVFGESNFRSQIIWLFAVDWMLWLGGYGLCWLVCDWV